MITWEIKKILKSRNGIIALVLFFILSVSMVFMKPQTGDINNYGNENYQSVQDGNRKTITVQEQFEMKVEQLRELSKTEVKDDVSKDIKEISSKKLSAIESNEYKDVKFWKVFNHRMSHPFMMFIMLVIITIVFSNIYTDEVVSNVDDLILSSRNKSKALYSKLALSIGIPAVLYIVHLVTQFIITYIQYGKPINGDLQAIRIVDNIILLKDAYTINEFILLKIGIILIILMTLGVVASLFSFITKNSIQSTSGFLIFVILGKLITLVKVLPKEVLAIFSKINYIDLVFYFNTFAGMYFGRINLFNMSLDITNLCIGIMISILFISIFLCTRIFKSFLTR
ncbi:putative membrane protein [Gottschalkia acidurici 9a]|uniref:Membrane protein n=1 Tax=Gottschalkia acidurici (strain ATCC 7906 / DSM 604 / BCRC 14475 / CIP 104303 / KCTC 5404 / NCIMB 10678 / 9a) TaxID=1128398 RepID=K0AUP3_GOTA9|nr:membrane protein [Gottschalkia acidurici]AFS77598.1 putative membrane protein [Gottschalkia acidurici 9a]